MIVDDIQDMIQDFTQRYGWRPNTIYFSAQHRLRLVAEMRMVCLIKVDHCCGLLIRNTFEKEMYVGLI
jgi:hypothetical protein